MRLTANLVRVLIVILAALAVVVLLSGCISSTPRIPDLLPHPEASSAGHRAELIASDLDAARKQKVELDAKVASLEAAAVQADRLAREERIRRIVWWATGVGVLLLLGGVAVGLAVAVLRRVGLVVAGVGAGLVVAAWAVAAILPYLTIIVWVALAGGLGLAVWHGRRLLIAARSSAGIADAFEGQLERALAALKETTGSPASVVARIEAEVKSAKAKAMVEQATAGARKIVQSVRGK